MDQSYSMEKPKKRGTWKLLTVVFALLFLAAFFTKGFTTWSITGKAVLSQNDAEKRADDFLQKYIAVPGVNMKINSISQESGLYSLNISATANNQSQNAKAFITKDGKLFILQAIPIDEIDKMLAQQQLQQAAQQPATQ